VRVIAGRLGGRIFDAPKTNRTHPMSEKVCGALFGILGDVDGLTFLDAFAGSGAISFEACSRGARQVTAIESSRQAAQTIAENIETLGLQEDVQLVRASNDAWMSTNDGVKFDVVICGPPYDDLQIKTIDKLSKHVSKDGILVLSWPGAETVPEIAELEQVEWRSYGDAQLIFYRA
jgi:16S rRNA (guanine966-N2)-methyltransferase